LQAHAIGITDASVIVTLHTRHFNRHNATQRNIMSKRVKLIKKLNDRFLL